MTQEADGQWGSLSASSTASEAMGALQVLLDHLGGLMIVAEETIFDEKDRILEGHEDDRGLLGLKQDVEQALRGKSQDIEGKLSTDAMFATFAIQHERDEAVNRIRSGSCDGEETGHSIDPSLPQDKGPSPIFWNEKV
jgi:hypothetical protein